MNIDTAQREYYRRPTDERFESLQALVTACQADREICHEARYNLRDLHVAPTGGDVELVSPKGNATLTHYSFGQLCRTVKAPASYLRDLPAALIAENLNHGLHEAAPVGTTANILVRDDPSKPAPVVRACTSETYGRAWDGSFYGELQRQFGDGLQSNGGRWMTPPAWPGSKPSGNYRGDRDSFVIRVDGGSIVTDPSASQGDGQALYRGILARNSEVGECSISLEAILFRYVCGNHMLWGAISDSKYKRRHVGDHAIKDAIREMGKLAWKFNERSASQDERIIKALIDHELAHTEEAVIDELQKLGATKAQAIEAYQTAERTEKASPRSFWGLAQGMTRVSQVSGYQDERLKLDQLAAAVLKVGAKQYATV